MDMLPIDALEERGIYRITARNFFVGAWDGVSGFIGIREKLGHRYLSTEYHHDVSAYFGTARPWEKIGEVPPGIELIESTTECKTCGQPAHFMSDPGTYRGRYYHDADDSAIHEGGAVALNYQPLFDVLEPLAKAEDERWAAEEDSRIIRKNPEEQR